jgi:hypothetical protein
MNRHANVMIHTLIILVYALPVLIRAKIVYPILNVKVAKTNSTYKEVDV